jgi:hypothetical protein
MYHPRRLLRLQCIVVRYGVWVGPRQLCQYRGIHLCRFVRGLRVVAEQARLLPSESRERSVVLTVEVKQSNASAGLHREIRASVPSARRSD